VRANVRKVAAALDRKREGEAVIARMDAQLSRFGWGGEGTLGALSDAGRLHRRFRHLIDAMLKAAGYSNANTAPYFAPVSLEQMVMTPPTAVVLGLFDLARAVRIAGDRGATRR
jgi:iron complex transport system substrate-binding protein